MSTTDTTGRIVRNTGAHYVVETPEGREINCKVKGNFRIKGLRTTNPVAVGDFVHVAPPGPDGRVTSSPPTSTRPCSWHRSPTPPPAPTS